jgi:predicted dehydrogenase
VAQIGVGQWGNNHKRVLQDLGVLVATCDTNGKEDYSDWKEMVRDEKFTHVVICTPPETHYEIAGWMLNSGKNVFVEKPMAMNAGECKDLVELAEEKKLILQCGYIERYNKLVKKVDVKEFMVFIRENKHYSHVKTDIVRDTAVHDIELAIGFFGKMPIDVMSDIHANYSTLILKFKDGVATIITNWISDKKIRTINNQSTIGSEDILRLELEDFLTRDEFIDYNALNVARVVEAIYDN